MKKHVDLYFMVTLRELSNPNSDWNLGLQLALGGYNIAKGIGIWTVISGSTPYLMAQSWSGNFKLGWGPQGREVRCYERGGSEKKPSFVLFDCPAYIGDSVKSSYGEGGILNPFNTAGLNCYIEWDRVKDSDVPDWQP